MNSLASKICRAAIAQNVEIRSAAILILIAGKYMVQSWRSFPDVEGLRLEKIFFNHETFLEDLQCNRHGL